MYRYTTNVSQFYPSLICHGPLKILWELQLGKDAENARLEIPSFPLTELMFQESSEKEWQWMKHGSL